MRHSPFFRSRWLSLPAVLTLAATVQACSEDPSGPRAVAGRPVRDHAGNHPASAGGGTVFITIPQDPLITPSNAFPGQCNFEYFFEIDGKGPARRVRWRAHWIGGEHDGVQLGENFIDIGSKLDTYIGTPLTIHPSDGHTFDAIRIRVVGESGGPVLAEEFTEGGTMSCL